MTEVAVAPAGPTQTGGREATTGHIAGDCVIAVGMPETEAPPGWRWKLLAKVARLETGHTPSRGHPENWGGDIPWIGIRDATANQGHQGTPMCIARTAFTGASTLFAVRPATEPVC